MTYKRTDLALEQTELYREGVKGKSELDGIKVTEETNKLFKITRVNVLTENAVKKLSKPAGMYVTLESCDLSYQDHTQYKEACKIIADELEKICELDLGKPTLVVGLGNRNITADALGPKVVEQMLVTRHLFEQMPEVVGEDTASVCALAPGVLGITGIETMEIVKGVVDRIKPGLVIAIDALAARKIERINTTIQISDTGICPGSGVGNNRKALNYDTLGVKVISVGMPTVVDAVTMANDTLDMTIEAIKESADEKKGIFLVLDKLSDEEKYSLIHQVLTSKIGDMVLSVKEIDMMMGKISKIIAGAINKFLQKKMTIDEIESFVQ